MSATETIPTANDARGAHSLRRFVRGHNHVTLYLGDCLEIAPTLTGVDAVISDPPYGMNLDTDNSRFSGGNTASIARRGNGIGTGGGKGIIGDDEPFDPTPWLDYPAVVLFGSNHYAQRLPVGTTLVWLKRFDEGFGSFLSDAEVAWMKGGHGVYVKRDTSLKADEKNRLHQNQKPVPIMAWCLDMAKVPKGATVCDPYMGSGSTGIACLRTGRNFIGVEKDATHYATALERMRSEVEETLL